MSVQSNCHCGIPLQKSNKYCSNVCYYNRSPKINRSCIVCEMSFSVHPNRLRNQPDKYGRFCSRKCFGKNRTQEATKKFWNSIKQCIHGDICLYCCWEWKGNSFHKFGYGVTQLNNKLTHAHRIAYELFHKRQLTNYCLHLCDNPPCCNPLHLYEGTLKDNAQDAINRGRHTAQIYKDFIIYHGNDGIEWINQLSLPMRE